MHIYLFNFLSFILFRIIKRDDNGKYLTDLCTPIQKLQGWQLTIQAMLALFNKKITYTRKNAGILLVTVRISLILLYNKLNHFIKILFYLIIHFFFSYFYL